MKHIIVCPLCKKGEIHFDFNLFLTGADFQCSEPTCNTSVKLPEDSQEPVKAAFEQLKKLR